MYFNSNFKKHFLIFLDLIHDLIKALKYDQYMSGLWCDHDTLQFVDDTPQNMICTLFTLIGLIWLGR